jgi:uncharacterized protein YxjI
MSQNEQGIQLNETQDHRSQGPSSGKIYKLHQKMVSLGKDYWIENEQGVQVYKVDGKVLTLYKTFYFEDVHGKKLAKIKKHIATVKQTMEVEGPDGEKLALVKKDLFTPLKEHFVVKVKDGPDLDVHGNILDYEYTIGDGQSKIAQVSKKFFNIRDSYSIAVEPGQDDVIILAIVLCIDEMTHTTR